MEIIIGLYIIGIIFTAIYLGRKQYKAKEYDNLAFLYIVLSLFWPIVWIIKIGGTSEHKQRN